MMCVNIEINFWFKQRVDYYWIIMVLLWKIRCRFIVCKDSEQIKQKGCVTITDNILTTKMIEQLLKIL